MACFSEILQEGLYSALQGDIVNVGQLASRQGLWQDTGQKAEKLAHSTTTIIAATNTSKENKSHTCLL